MLSRYDILIVGGGPAGLQAAISAATEGLTVLVVDKGRFGGLIRETPLLENYGPIPGPITGVDFTQMMLNRCRAFKVDFLPGATVEGWKAGSEGQFIVTLKESMTFDIQVDHIILATGRRWQSINHGVKGLKAAVNTGRAFYGPAEVLSIPVEGESATVYGGGPAAAQAILNLSQKFNRVHAVMRSNLNCPQYLVDRILKEPRVRLLAFTKLTSVHKDRLGLVNRRGNLSISLPGPLFICAGLVPNTEWLKPMGLAMNDEGKLVTGENQASPLETSVPNVFAIGDCRAGSTPRVGSAIGEGSMVVTEIWAKKMVLA